ncbi:MAG TPA: hypothetical protein VF282_03175 [Bacillota bacterium]
MADRLRRLLLVAGWAGAALAVHVLTDGHSWPEWVVVPLAYAAYPLALGLLGRMLGTGPPRQEIAVLEDVIRDFLVFLMLGLAAVPLLGWAGAVAGTRLSPAVPLAAAYAVYVLWPRGDPR